MESTSEDCHVAPNLDDSLSFDNVNDERVGLEEDVASEAIPGLQGKGKRRRKHTSSIWYFF